MNMIALSRDVIAFGSTIEVRSVLQTSAADELVSEQYSPEFRILAGPLVWNKLRERQTEIISRPFSVCYQALIQEFRRGGGGGGGGGWTRGGKRGWVREGDVRARKFFYWR